MFTLCWGVIWWTTMIKTTTWRRLFIWLMMMGEMQCLMWSVMTIQYLLFVSFKDARKWRKCYLWQVSLIKSKLTFELVELVLMEEFTVWKEQIWTQKLCCQVLLKIADRLNTKILYFAGTIILLMLLVLLVW